MALNNGLEIPFGIRPTNAVPVDVYSGPYTGATLNEAINTANTNIPSAVRFQSMEVRLIVGGTAYKYWYRDGINDGDLVAFSSSSTSGGISSGSVSSGYLADNSVLSGNIASGQISRFHIASGEVVKNIYAGNNVSITWDSEGGATINATGTASGLTGAPLYFSSGLVANVSGAYYDGTSSLTIGLLEQGVASGSLAFGSVLSGNIASGQVSTNHLASGTLLNVNNPADNRILTSLNSGQNAIQANSNLTYDGTTLNISSTQSGSTVFNIDGVNGNILTITDGVQDSLLQIENSQNKVVFTVHDDGFTQTTSAIFSGQTSTFTVFQTNKNNGTAAFIDYYIKASSGTALRAGNLVVVWDSSSDQVEFTETTTRDIGTSTDSVLFVSAVVSGNICINAEIHSGTWNGKLGARIL